MDDDDDDDDVNNTHHGEEGRRTTLLDRPEFSSRNLATEDGYSLDRPTGLHLAWIGDSVTRYQFLSLIHFLHTGRWVMDADFPNIVDISTFNNVWVDFFEYSSYILGQEQGQHQCDCYRASGGADGKHIFENRYYRDPARDNYLYFFTKMGSHPFHGRSSPGKYPSGIPPLSTTLTKERSYGDITVGEP